MSGALGGFLGFSVNNPRGQREFITSGTFIAPAGVYSVSAVAVGGGGGGGTTSADASTGGGGGGLGWKNNIPVVPGTSYTVTVGAAGVVAGAAGGQSLFINSATVAGNGGATGTAVTAATGGAGGTFVGDGGGNGGDGGGATTSDGTGTAEAGGGGGAGGYSGNGGKGAGNTASFVGSAGTGGAGGGGGSPDTGQAGGGGGVGLLGQGANGAGGTGAVQGGGGSGGAGGATSPIGALYGGGGAGSDSSTSGAGAAGAVRIIWGTGRAFPATNTGDLDPQGRTPILTYSFNTGVEGWTAGSGAVSATGGIMTFTQTANDPILNSPAVSFSGSTGRFINIYIRKASTTPFATWDGSVYYQTSGHGISESFTKKFAQPIWTGDYQTISLDMSVLNNGGSDWTNSTITQIRFDFSAIAGDSLFIDTIYIS
jgi:hypothetical protein